MNYSNRKNHTIGIGIITVAMRAKRVEAHLYVRAANICSVTVSNGDKFRTLSVGVTLTQRKRHSRDITCCTSASDPQSIVWGFKTHDTDSGQPMQMMQMDRS